VVDGFEERVALRLKRNDRWFAAKDAGGNTQRPYLDAFHAYFLPGEDPFARAAFDRRIVDATAFNDSAEIGRAHSTNLSDITLEEADAGAIFAARLLLDRAPFQDPRARSAVHLALDRAALIEGMMPPASGAPSAKLSAPIAPGAMSWALDPERLATRPGYRADPTGRAEDIAEAKALWQAAMGTDPADLRITFAGLPEMIPHRAVELIRTQLQGALGVNVISHTDTSGHALITSAYMRNLEAATEGALTFTFGLDDGGVDLDDWLFPQFRSGGALNTYRLQDPQLDHLLDAQRREFDVDARRQLGLDAQEYLLANVNARLEIFAPVARRLTWGYVRGSRAPLWHGSTQDLADVWLDAGNPAYAGRPGAI
jgi:ABC-type transport system substrate-binding protein